VSVLTGKLYFEMPFLAQFESSDISILSNVAKILFWILITNRFTKLTHILDISFYEIHTNLQYNFLIVYPKPE
jgi:hypothetical protein